MDQHAHDEGDDGAYPAGRDDELARLVPSAARGEPAALNRFLRLIRSDVLRYCRARLGPGTVCGQAPDDVAQDVLLAVCGALRSYRAGEVPVMAFVYGIARFKVADVFRAARRDLSEPTDDVPDRTDTGGGPELAAVSRSETDELRRLLDQLPENHREILVLRVALGFSGEETARMVGSTAGAVRVTQHRALTALRMLVAELPLD